MAAAAARKLAKEIEDTLKKVGNGLDEFAELFDEASTAGAREKEKLGEEMKKSINKQQRLRAQIRDWIAGNVDSKLRPKLEEARKAIEADMQRFKEFERDLKTKAFSTFALQKDEDMDLEEEEKLRSHQWVEETIQSLNFQIDEFEADLLSGSADSKERLEINMDRHRWHISKLEQILRALDNDAIDISELTIVREMVDMYLENYQDADYPHDETLYDCFDLTEFEVHDVSAPSPVAKAKTGDGDKSPSADPAGDPYKDKKGKDRNKKKDKKTEAKKDPKASPSVKPGTKADGKAKGSEKGIKGDGRGSTPATGSSSAPSIGHGEPGEVKVQEDQLLGEAEEFVCKICYVHVVCCGPVLTSCSHLFCGDCFARWIEQHPESQSWAQRAKQGPERTVPCPVCKQDLAVKSDLHPVSGSTSRSENLLLWRMLSSLKIMCCNNPKVRSGGRCDWIGEYGTFQRHIKVCPDEEHPEGVDHDTSYAEERESTPHGSRGGSGTTTPSQAASPVHNPAHNPDQRITISLADMGLPSASMGGSSTPIVVPPDANPRSPARSPMTPAPTQAPMPKSPHGQGAYGYARVVDSPQSTPTVSQPSLKAPAQEPAPIKTPVVVTPPAHKQLTSTPKPAPTSSPKAQAKAAPPAAAARAVSPAPASAPTVMTRGVAAHAFEPTNATMLLVRTGDTLEVLEQHDSGWSFCRNASAAEREGKPVSEAASGWVPSWACPKEPEPATTPEPQSAPAAPPVPERPQVPEATRTEVPARQFVEVASPFTATAPSQLTVGPKDLIEIIERHESGWTYGRKGGSTEGWFPDWAVAQ